MFRCSWNRETALLSRDIKTLVAQLVLTANPYQLNGVDWRGHRLGSGLTFDMTFPALVRGTLFLAPVAIFPLKEVLLMRLLTRLPQKSQHNSREAIFGIHVGGGSAFSDSLLCKA